MSTECEVIKKPLDCAVCQDHLKGIQLTLELAFPDGPEKHGEYHQSLIDAAKAQKKFWEDLSTDLKKNGIRAVILIVLGMVVLKLFGAEAAKTMLKLVF